MTILMTSRHRPQYLSCRDVTRIGNILCVTLPLLKKRAIGTMHWKKRVTEMVMLSVHGPSLFPLFFRSLIFEFPTRRKKGGGDPLDPLASHILNKSYYLGSMIPPGGPHVIPTFFFFSSQGQGASHHVTIHAFILWIREWIQGFSDAGNCLNPSRVRLGEHHHHHILPYFSLLIPHLLGTVGKRVLEIVGRACAI